jgi:hypothetical protein
VTEADMYPLSLPWRFEFSDRIDRGAVVSVARMDPHFYGLDRDPARLLRRGEKMVTKNVGILVFGRQPSPDARSVLSTPGGLPDLDYMTLDFDPKPFSSAKRTWLGSVGVACARAGRLERKLGYKKPSHAQITQLLKRLVVIEESLYADLRAAPPAAEDRVGVTRMLRTYAAWLRVNIHAADALSRRWDDAVFARWRGQTVQFGSEVAGDMLELGSRQCAAHVS